MTRVGSPRSGWSEVLRRAAFTCHYLATAISILERAASGVALIARAYGKVRWTTARLKGLLRHGLR